jgi:hypothetical protein
MDPAVADLVGGRLRLLPVPEELAGIACAHTDFTDLAGTHRDAFRVQHRDLETGECAAHRIRFGGKGIHGCATVELAHRYTAGDYLADLPALLSNSALT